MSDDFEANFDGIMLAIIMVLCMLAYHVIVENHSQNVAVKACGSCEAVGKICGELVCTKSRGWIR